MEDKTIIQNQDKTIIQSNDKTIIQSQDRTIIQNQAQDEKQDVANIQNNISGYQIIRHISSGGESDIYLAEKEGQKCILKIYRKGFKPDIDVTNKIKDLSQKYPEDLVQLYEFFFKDDIFHEVYEYCELGSLADIIKDKDKRPKLKKKDTILDFVKQVNNGLKILHQNNIYHRDLKPSNILIRKDFDIVLSDFGIARQVDMSTIYTQGFKGTYVYSAPETFANQFTKKSDYWSLGIILYEIIQGENPFSGLSQEAIIATLLRENQEPVEINIEDKELERLIKGLLTRNPDKRWGSYEVDRFLRGEEVGVYYNEKGTSSKKIDIEEWALYGFTEETAKGWILIGATPKQAYEFKKAGFIPIEARDWIKVGIDANSAKKWVNLGIDIDSILEAKKYNITVDKVEEYVNKGIHPEDAIKAINYGISPDDVKEFLKNGFSLDEAKNWKADRFSRDSIREKLICSDSEIECYLPPTKLVFNETLTIKSKKHIKGHQVKNTELIISDIEIDTTDEVIFEHLSFTSLKEHSDIAIKNGRVVFRNIRCSGIQIKLLGGELIFENEVHMENIETALLLYSGKVQELENIKFYEVNNPWKIAEEGKEGIAEEDRKVEICFNNKAELNLKKPVIISHCILDITGENSEKVKFINSDKGCFKVTDGGILKMKNIEITHENQEKPDEFNALLEVFSNAEIVLDNCIIRNSPGIGIMISSCKSAYISNCIVEGCGGNGIGIKDQSEVEIKDTKVFRNGTERENYPQIWIEDSMVSLKEVEIRESNGGTGVHIKKGRVDMEGAIVSENQVNGICIQAQSEVEIKNSKVFKNGTEGQTYAQIYIEDSKVSLKNVSISNIVGNGSGVWIVSSNVNIKDSEITKNRGGVTIKDKANVLIENCSIYDNGQSFYEDGIGVYSDKALVTLKNVRTWGNKWGLSYKGEYKKNIKAVNCEFKDGITTNIACFITTAVINTLNKPDNCYELNCLRKFRDEWLRKQKDGEILINEYYQIAPLIVAAINKEPEADKIYFYLWENYISRCIKFIETKQYIDCKALYMEMVERLKEKYLNKSRKPFPK